MRVLVELARERVGRLKQRDRVTRQEMEGWESGTVKWMAEMAAKRNAENGLKLGFGNRNDVAGNTGIEVAFLALWPVILVVFVVMWCVRVMFAIRVRIVLWRLRKRFRERVCGECMYPCGEDAEMGPERCPECGASWPLVPYASMPEVVRRRYETVAAGK